MTPRRLPLILAAAICAAGTGCATLFAPGPDHVRITSIPDGAMVLLDGVPVGETPTVIEIPRSSRGLLTLELNGHETRRVALDKGFNPVTLINLAWGPLFIITMAVDAVSGDIVKYPEAPITIRMMPRHGREEVPPPGEPGG